jgi:hypothetical protein
MPRPIVMIHALTQSALVLLIGIYAIRASWFLFSSGALTPLTPVAAAIVGLCVYLFHRAPTQTGPFLWGVLAACAVGAIANALLLTSTSPAYRNPTNMTFSALSVALWIALALLLWQGARAGQAAGS